MNWLLIAVTMFPDNQPHRYEQIASFETREVCQYAPEGLGVNRGGTPDTVIGENRKAPWVVEFRCIPSTDAALRETLDAEEKAALFLAGRGDYEAPWWKDRLDEIRRIRRD